jgi:3-oxoacyl-[acyl-carrier protein] reductase
VLASRIAAMNVSLKNQVAVITGGSRGIGAATVRAFTEAGARVVFSYRQAGRAARELARACDPGGRSVIAVRTEVTKMGDARKLVETAVRRFGRLDVLVANAGFWNDEPAPIQTLSDREWERMIAVNLKGVYTVIRCGVPHMIRQRRGCIIAVSSTAGQRGEPLHTHYGAAKGGVISLVKGLSTELAPHGIRVNCVAPGWVDTDMCKGVLGDRRAARKIAAGIPMERVARPEEIALPILFLASEMSSYITGEVLNANGGNVLCG